MSISIAMSSVKLQMYFLRNALHCPIEMVFVCIKYFSPKDEVNNVDNVISCKIKYCDTITRLRISITLFMFAPMLLMLHHFKIFCVGSTHMKLLLIIRAKRWKKVCVRRCFRNFMIPTIFRWMRLDHKSEWSSHGDFMNSMNLCVC